MSNPTSSPYLTYVCHRIHNDLTFHADHAKVKYHAEIRTHGRSKIDEIDIEHIEEKLTGIKTISACQGRHISGGSSENFETSDFNFKRYLLALTDIGGVDVVRSMLAQLL